MHPIHRRCLAASAVAAAALFAGCGASSKRPAAEIRGFDAATNAGTTTIEVNGSPLNDSMTLAQAPTDYLYVETNSSIAFTFTTFITQADGGTVTALPSLVTAPTTTVNLNSGTFYTAYLVGRPDLASNSTTKYPGSMQVVIYPDPSGSPSSGASLRVLNSAPNAGTAGVDVYVDGTLVVGGTTFGVMSSFAAISAGPHTVQIDATGTTTPLFPATTITFTTGHYATLVALEPTSPTLASPSGVATYSDALIEN